MSSGMFTIKAREKTMKTVTASNFVKLMNEILKLPSLIEGTSRTPWWRVEGKQEYHRQTAKNWNNENIKTIRINRKSILHTKEYY